MPKVRGNVVTLKEFEGHYTAEDGQIPENGFASLVNCEVTDKGTLATRRGIANHGSQTADGGIILGRWRTSQGTDKLVVRDNGATAIKFMNLDCSTGVTTFTTTAANLLLQHNDKAFLFGVGSNLRTWDGFTNTLTAVTYKATVGIVYKSRMFIANNASATVTSSQLRFSELFTTDPATAGAWGANNFISVDSSDGDFITAVAVLNDQLIIFKRFSTWSLTYSIEPADGELRNLHPTIGCIGRDTVVVIGGLLYFRSAMGIFRTDGSTFELLSANVKEDFDTASASVTLCNARSAIEYDGKYLTSFNDSSTIHVYNIETGAWSKWVTTNTFTRLLSLPDQAPWEWRTWFAGATGKCGIYDDLGGFVDENSTTYDVSIVTKNTNFDKPELAKQIKEIALDCNTEFGSNTLTIEVEYVKDHTSTIGPYTDTVTNAFKRKYLRFTGPGKCRFLETAFTYTPTVYSEINSISYDISTRERVGRAR